MTQNPGGTCEAILSDITGYIDYLRREQGLQITLHYLDQLYPYGERLVPYNIHSNTLCLYAKQSFPFWRHCIDRQKKVLCHCQGGPYFGMCWAGVSEFVFPVEDERGECPMFISVSGYAADREQAKQRIRRVSRDYSLNYDDMMSIFDTTLNHDVPPLERVKTLISPLSRMLTLLFICASPFTSLLNGESQDSDQIFSQIVRYIHRNYTRDITLKEISGTFNCSPSFISHLFNRRVGLSIPSYINKRRIDIAKQFLTNTNMSIQEIAYTLGFNDSNYFSTLFRRACGYSPRAWRKQAPPADQCKTHSESARS